MQKQDEYSISVEWSDEDKTFVARVAEFPSLAAHGITEEAAIAEIQSVVQFVQRDLSPDESVV